MKNFDFQCLECGCFLSGDNVDRQLTEEEEVTCSKCGSHA